MGLGGGGAIFCDNSSPTIINCIIKENTVQVDHYCCADCGVETDRFDLSLRVFLCRECNLEIMKANERAETKEISKEMQLKKDKRQEIHETIKNHISLRGYY